MGRIRNRLTFANIVSVIALFVALGGTALGASYVISSNSQVAPGTISGHNPPSGAHQNILPGSVNSLDLASGAIKTRKLANFAVTHGKLAQDAVNGIDVLDNSLSGDDVNESSFGQVPTASNADTVGGKTAAELEGARAFAVVRGGPLCADPPSFCQLYHSKGVAYAAHVSASTYCIGVTAISAQDPTSVAVVTPNSGSPDVWARWRGAQEGNVLCNGSEFEVLTGVGQNGAHLDFTIVIP